MIDRLVKIYNNWGDRPENNNLQPLGSADEMIMHETATMDQCHWLERFLDVWNRVQERDSKKQKGITIDYDLELTEKEKRLIKELNNG